MPGGRAGMVEEAGYRLDNGPTVLTMPNLLADAFAAVGADMADFVTIVPVDPMYRACYADGSVLHVRHGRERDDGGDPPPSPGPRRPRRSTGSATGWPSCTGSRWTSSSTPTSTRCSTWSGRWRAGLRLIRLGGFGKLGKRVAIVLRRRAPAADLLVPVDVRRAGAVRGAGALRGDHVHGLGRGRVRPRGRHAPYGVGPGRSGREGRGRRSATTRPVDA